MQKKAENLTKRWVTLELSPIGENAVLEDTISKLLRRDLRVSQDFPIFVPAKSYKKRGLPATMVLLEGYVFVGEGLSHSAYFDLEAKPYVERVLSQDQTDGKRVPQFIEHSSIIGLERKLKNLDVPKLKPGDDVLVLQGLYKGLQGKVLETVSDTDAIVAMSLRSISIVAQVPSVFLEPFDGAEE